MLEQAQAEQAQAEQAQARRKKMISKKKKRSIIGAGIAEQAQVPQEQDDIEEELSEDPINNNNSHENITIEQC